MPARLNAPVLTVDAGLIHKLDTRNSENLFSMWTVLSRCSESIEGGKRYENLSWRLWSREVFCCDPKSDFAVPTPTMPVSARHLEAQSPNELPSLSGSVDSLVYQEEAIDFESDSSSDVTSAPLDMHSSRTDSMSSRVSRGRERHITPQDLEKMVFTIKEKKELEPLSPATASPIVESVLVPLVEDSKTPKIITELTSKPSTPVQCSITSDCASEHSSQTTSDGASGVSERSTTSIVRGFSPSHVSSSFRTVPLVTAPSSEEVAVTKTKKHAMFALGGSSGEDSLSEHTNAIEQHNLQPLRPKKKNAVFSFGGSSNEEESSLPHNMANGVPNGLTRPPVVRKQTSFKEELASRTILEESSALSDDVFETDDEDEIDESAIDDDDDSSDWEDSVEDSGNPSIDEKTFFQRVPSRPVLTTRPSLITTMLHQNDRAAALAQAAANTSRSTPALLRSRTTSPNGPSLAASPDSDDAGLMMKRNNQGLNPIAEIPRSSAQPILPVPTSGPQQLALSPRTTRRKMINDELTNSLRQHLVHEHRQKSQTANAVLTRRHTTQDVVNLKQFPEKMHMNSKEGDMVNASWNQYFGQGLGEYHSKGW